MKIFNTKPVNEAIHVYAAPTKGDEARVVIKHYDLGYEARSLYIHLELDEAKQLRMFLDEAITKCEKLAQQSNEDDE